MVLIQILLPLYDNAHQRFDAGLFEQVRGELVDRFGGLTAFVRSPATGLWKDTPFTSVRDEIVIYEIMSAEVDRVWWSEYRRDLARRFGQEQLVVRAMDIELL